MTDHFETLSYVISNLFRIYAMYLFSNAYFRGQGKVKNGVTLALFFGYFIVNSVGNLIYPSTFINMLTNVVPYFLLTIDCQVKCNTIREKNFEAPRRESEN